DDVRTVATGGAHDCLHAVEHSAGLLLEVGGDHLAVGPHAALPRDGEPSTGLDAVRVAVATGVSQFVHCEVHTLCAHYCSLPRVMFPRAISMSLASWLRSRSNTLPSRTRATPSTKTVCTSAR